MKPTPRQPITLELTATQRHDLRVLAGIPPEALRQALKLSTSPWHNKDERYQTHDIYHLLPWLFEQLGPKPKWRQPKAK